MNSKNQQNDDKKQKQQVQKKDAEVNQSIKCHFVSNTHWDREWRFSMQRTRHLLVNYIDMLLDIFEKQPDYKSFHLDSQTIPLLDYLEIRPEKESLIKKLVAGKKLLVGPWFTLPDEFSISGESIIRNLLLGHKIAKSFGYVSKTGYSPFSWGQISQMPQIYKGFGIDMTAFYRGVNTQVAPRSEFIWQGPDGTEILASRLGKRPRYNVWYVLQRPVYWNIEDENDRNVVWNCGYAPFKLMNKEFTDIDMKYAHPPFEYHKENVKARACQAIQEQDDDWSTPHRFWSCGHDSSCPDIREVDLIKDSDQALEGKADVFHSTFEEFQRSVINSVSSDLAKATGEMRHYSDSSSTSPLLGWICSARMDIKQDNFRTERALIDYAEPLAVFSSMLGADYPRAFIDQAYQKLLENHGHDSIGGCSRGVVNEDMKYRFRQSREISTCITETALINLAGSIDLSDYSSDGIAVVVYNPSPFARSEVMKAEIVIPKKWNIVDFEIVDEKDQKIDMQICKTEDSYQYVQSPNDGVNMILTTKYDINLYLPEIPEMGYRTFLVRPLEKETLKFIKSMVTGSQMMENENIKVEINNNGTLKIFDKNSNQTYDRMGYFIDTAELGNPWEHNVGENIQTFTTLNEKARVCLVQDGHLEASYNVEIDWKLPAKKRIDEKGRSEKQEFVKIVNTVTLKKNSEWVDVITKIYNTVEDHYLQVVFPPGIQSDYVDVQSQFDVVRRSVVLPKNPDFREEPQTEQPMNSFLDITDGNNGLAILNEGLKAYEATESDKPELRLTLIRAFPLKLCATTEWTDYSKIDKSSQCLGLNEFHYAIMPHKGDWQNADIWFASERFNLSLLASQIAPTKYGTEPATKSFLEIASNGVSVSAVKKSENSDGWIVRLFNPSSKKISTKIRLNGGYAPSDTSSPVELLKKNMTLAGTSSKEWSKVQEVTLEELPQKVLDLKNDGWVEIELTPMKITTIEFLP
jgi:alpha-mannosidase